MDFKDFDMSDYFRLLAAFKKTHTDGIIKQFGSLEHFDRLVSEMKTHESQAAGMAVKLYGSLENYTRAMEQNLEKFLFEGPSFTQAQAKELVKKSKAIIRRLTADLNRDAASSEVQEIVREMITFANECNVGLDMGENYWPFMAEMYLTHPAYIEATDKEYGNGASSFIGRALQAYLER